MNEALRRVLCSTVWVFALAGPARADVPLPGASAADGIAWQRAIGDAEVDAAFASARAQNKPVFLYWGAKWCPPCNQLSATLFNRQDFIERSRAFVPVYIDGDSPGAQKLGARFKVSAYPTMVLFSPAGAELTRLPGEVDPQHYTEVLTLGINARRPVKTVLAQARLAPAQLNANDWRLLAFYSWETDEQQTVAVGQLPALLKQLADVCPPALRDTSTRLMLKAMAAAGAKGSAADDAQGRQRVLALLADPVAARAQMDVLTNEATAILNASAAPGSAQRAALLQAFDAALARLEADTTLSRADRLTALIARVQLVRVESPGKALPARLLADVRGQAAHAEQEVRNAYERQAVVTTAAYLLEQSGLLDESDALLQRQLAKSHAAYYLMSQLAANAKKRGDTLAALRWSQRAFDGAEGPATRLQWGAGLLGALVDLAPDEETRIERVAQQLFREAAAQPNAFYERSARSLQRVGRKLHAWNQRGEHAPVLQRLQVQLDAVCAGLPEDDAQRSVCHSLMKG